LEAFLVHLISANWNLLVQSLLSIQMLQHAMALSSEKSSKQIGVGAKATYHLLHPDSG
jgi:hypothetical protein